MVKVSTSIHQARVLLILLLSECSVIFLLAIVNAQSNYSVTVKLIVSFIIANAIVNRPLNISFAIQCESLLKYIINIELTYQFFFPDSSKIQIAKIIYLPYSQYKGTSQRSISSMQTPNFPIISQSYNIISICTHASIIGGSSVIISSQKMN